MSKYLDENGVAVIKDLCDESYATLGDMEEISDSGVFWDSEGLFYINTQEEE